MWGQGVGIPSLVVFTVVPSFARYHLFSFGSDNLEGRACRVKEETERVGNSLVDAETKYFPIDMCALSLQWYMQRYAAIGIEDSLVFDLPIAFFPSVSCFVHAPAICPALARSPRSHSRLLCIGGLHREPLLCPPPLIPRTPPVRKPQGRVHHQLLGVGGLAESGDPLRGGLGRSGPGGSALP